MNRRTDNPKITDALVRAMIAVRVGKVTQVFTAAGNVFRGPKGIAPACYRRLQAMRLIGDVPGQKSVAGSAMHVKQGLTQRGIEALNEGSAS